MARRTHAAGKYPYRATQNDPAIIIPEAVYARIVIAAEERQVSPGAWVETVLRNGLEAHNATMNDAAFEAACHDAEQRMSSAPQRHEWDARRRSHTPARS